jgi:periplasmic divalent cation tolerance protein
METHLQVVTTTEHKDDAESIGKMLVEKRLAACAQLVGPIVSTYWWKGAIETAEEWLCYVKTRNSLYDQLEKAIKAMHPYETPEIVAMPIVRGSNDYLEWIDTEVNKV